MLCLFGAILGASLRWLESILRVDFEFVLFSVRTEASRTAESGWGLEGLDATTEEQHDEATAS